MRNEASDGDGTLRPAPKTVNRKSTVRFRVPEKRPAYRPAAQAANASSGVETVPCFTEDQGIELTFFLETRVVLVPTVQVPERGPGFWKDGVFVSPCGDAINADCKRAASGHLYSARNIVDHRWFAEEVKPEHIVWRKAPPDWEQRQERGDYTTLETDRPEVAPWLRKEPA